VPAARTAGRQSAGEKSRLFAAANGRMYRGPSSVLVSEGEGGDEPAAKTGTNDAAGRKALGVCLAALIVGLAERMPHRTLLWINPRAHVPRSRV
jgi:hypothetical protein